MRRAALGWINCPRPRRFAGESFQQGVQALVAQRPGSDAEALHEVLDDYIAGFAELAQQPVVLH